MVFVLQVLEPSRVLSVIHTFDCHTGEVTAVSKSFFDSSAVFYVAAQLSSPLVGRSVAWRHTELWCSRQRSLLRSCIFDVMHSSAPLCCVTTKTVATVSLCGRRWKGKGGGGEIGRSSPHSPSASLPLFPFKACHSGHVIKSGEMRGYRRLPHVNIARSTGSRTRNCSNKNPEGKIKLPSSRNNSHIQSLHQKLMLACADSRDFTIERREGSENVASKMNLPSFVFIAIISTHLLR